MFWCDRGKVSQKSLKSEGDKLIRIYTYDNFTSQNSILNHFMKYLNNVYYLNYKMCVNFS